MAEEQARAAPKKKLPLKTLIILAAVMIVEGAAISGVYLLSGGPAAVRADSAAADDEAAKNELVEELVVEGKFQNTKTNRAYLYDTQVYVKVRQKHRDTVTKELESKRAAITMEIASIIRSAEPVHLREANLATLTRQITAALQQMLSADEDTGESKVEEVTIPMFMQYRTDL